MHVWDAVFCTWYCSCNSLCFFVNVMVYEKLVQNHRLQLTMKAFSMAFINNLLFLMMSTTCQ